SRLFLCLRIKVDRNGHAFRHRGRGNRQGELLAAEEDFDNLTVSRQHLSLSDADKDARLLGLGEAVILGPDPTVVLVCPKHTIFIRTPRILSPLKLAIEPANQGSIFVKGKRLIRIGKS